MLEAEVVFGGLDRLRGTIDGALEIYDADAFFVLTGCTAGIIGDDVHEVARTYREKGEAVYALDCAGFLGDTFRGYDIAFDALLKQLIEAAPRRERLVNIFGVVPYHNPFWEGTLEELTRLLGRLDLEVNTFFTQGQGIASVRDCSAAALNIILSPWLLKPFAQSFEQRFGTPELRWPYLPLGATDTSAFLRAVGAALSLDPDTVEAVIEDEERYVYHYLETIIGALSWKQFAVVGDSQSVVGMLRFLANDYSFTPLVAIITDPLFREADIASVRAALSDLEYAQPPEIVFASDQFIIEETLRAYPQISLLVGSGNDSAIARELDAQFIPAVFPLSGRLTLNRSYYGYRGSLTFIEDIYDNF
jgi:nitrogenase molybdenum-iron protein beta chain